MIRRRPARTVRPDPNELDLRRARAERDGRLDRLFDVLGINGLLELDGEQAETVRWLAGRSDEVVDGVCSLIRRARAAATTSPGGSATAGGVVGIAPAPWPPRG